MVIMDNITNFYFPLNICAEINRYNLNQYHEIKILKLPQSTQISTKIQGSFLIKLHAPYARNISPELLINEDKYHEEYNTLRLRYDKIELPKHAYKLYTNIISDAINEVILRVNNSILNTKISDELIPTFLLTKAQFCHNLTYHAGKPSKTHYRTNLFANFHDGSMPAYISSYNTSSGSEIFDDYFKTNRRVVFIRDGEPLPTNLLYHNEYQTPLRHGFFIHPDDHDSVIRFAIYKSLLQEGGDRRSTEVYYNNKGKCVLGPDAIYSYGNMGFPIVTTTKMEFDECIKSFIDYATKILFALDPTLLENVPHIHEYSNSKTLFTSKTLPVINHNQIPVANNVLGDVRLTQIYTAYPNNFAGMSDIMDKLKFSMAEPANDFYNGDWAIPHTSIIPFLLNYPVTETRYRPKPLMYNDTIQPMRGHGEDNTHYGLWLQKQEDESILNEILKFTNVMRPDLYQVSSTEIATGSMKPIYNSFMSMIAKFKTTKINKSTAKLMFMLASMVLNNFDKRSDLAAYRPVYNLSVLYLGAIIEPMVAITKSMGYRAEGMGLVAQSPNILRDVSDCNPEPYSIVISDIDFVGLTEDEFIDSVMNLLKLYSCPIAMKIYYSSAALSKLLISQRVNCYFAQLPMSSGFNERWLIVNEKGIAGSFVETSGFNMYFGSNYEYYATNTIIDIDTVFRPQVYVGVLNEFEIGVIAQYSDDCHVAQIGTTDNPVYKVSGLISTKSRNRGLLGTNRQSLSMLLARSKNLQPRLSSYSANVFDVYLDALILEAANDYYNEKRSEIIILDIGGRSVHDLPDLCFPYRYVAVNITRDFKLPLQLDAIYDTSINFAANMNAFIKELSLPVGTKIFALMRNFLFALPTVVASTITMQEFINDVRSYKNGNVMIWMNYFGIPQSIYRRFPNVKTKGWTTFTELNRFFTTLTFSTYPSDNVLVGLVEPVVNSVLRNPNYFSEVIESHGYTINRNKYMTSMYLLNLLQVYKSM